MSDWQRLSPEEVNEHASRELGVEVAHTHILAQWVRISEGNDELAGELTLFEDGSVQLDGTAPVEMLAHLMAAWHNSLKGKIA